MSPQWNFSSLKIEIDEELNQDYFDFQKRKILSNATSWTGRKGNKTVGFICVSSRFLPAIRVKNLRIIIIFGIMHASKYTGTNQCTFWNFIRPYLYINLCDSLKMLGKWGPHPQHFINKILSKLHFLSRTQITPRFSQLMLLTSLPNIFLIYYLMVFAC